MNVNLQEYLIKYHNLNILYHKERTNIKKKWLKKLRKSILSYLDTEITFLEFYKILKAVEKEGFGFYVKLLKFERLTSNGKERIINQGMEVGKRYMGGSSYGTIDDTGFEECIEQYSKLKFSKQIKPSDIINISNIEILNCIRKLDMKLYRYVINLTIEYLYNTIEIKQEELLKNIMIEILDDYGVSEQNYSFSGYREMAVCVEKEGKYWIIFDGERGNKYHKKKYYEFIEVCDEMLIKLSETTKDVEKLKRQLRLRIKTN